MSSDRWSGLKVFVVLTTILLLLRLLLGFAVVPPALAPFLSVLATIVFLGLPIVALFRAAGDPWTGKSASLALVAGAAVHAGGALALSSVLVSPGPATVLVQALVQVGIAFWTLGLGALVALVIKDKNMIVPIAIFLAGLDMFLVFNPDAWTSKVVRQNPAVFQSMAVKIPAVRPVTPKPEGAQIVNQAFVGPADLLFIATFFVVLAKFKMRVRETVKWLVPVMVLYLALVMAPIGLNMLPALVPIGVTVLLVNRRDFVMSKEERAMVWGSVFVAVALAGFGLYRHFTERRASPPVTLTSEASPSLPARGATPPKASAGQSR